MNGPHYAMTTLQAEGQAMDADDWQPDERTVRHALDAMELAFAQRFKHYAADGSQIDAYRCGKDAVEALLPKPDPVVALVEEWAANGNPPSDEEGAGAEHFARWLIDTGRIKP